MKTILVFNDNSPAAKHAIAFAVNIAKTTEAAILLANTSKISNKLADMVAAGTVTESKDDDLAMEILTPGIEELDISSMDENQIAGFVNSNQVWMMVKGMPNHPSELVAEDSINVQTILNKVLCPLLLVPVSWPIKQIERLVYITDLRYCRIKIVQYLTQLAKPHQADLLIAHLSAKGLPGIEQKYAIQLFNDQVTSNVKYEQLFFNNIKEDDLPTAVDVIINGMNNDLLVLVNHRFHFEEIIGRYLAATLPAHITIPLLIFPS
ncbi:universal stress protein [Mucilaginibacter sp. BJC16-A38]|uniref:universal stress protein n=1 Tax=Mucilaginibacter phenanthrenivorans TaxID=1234842 RepID=UPI002158495E|nr:universal stress protein [Mucilaginibacter phenanthrenivorans]MCR8559593.1 universal stress protein [Mucilaginibacter phenanthrenivorans]